MWNVLRTYKVTNFIFLTIFFYVQFIHRRLVKLKLIIFFILELSYWLQQLLEKTYGLRCQNRVMVNDSFTFRKTKSRRKQDKFMFVLCDSVTKSPATKRACFLRLLVFLKVKESLTITLFWHLRP